MTDGRAVYRDASQFKLANALTENDPDQEAADQGGESYCADLTQEIFRNAETHSGPVETSTRKEKVAESEMNSSEKSELPKVLETGARPKRNRQRRSYLEDYVV